MKAVSTYLDEQLISRRLTDLMMSRSSLDIYWLSNSDILEIGLFPPGLEEFFIRKCKYDPAGDTHELQLQVGSEERYELWKLNGESWRCRNSELDRINESGLKEIRRGWLPNKAFP